METNWKKETMSQHDENELINYRITSLETITAELLKELPAIRISLTELNTKLSGINASDCIVHREKISVLETKVKDLEDQVAGLLASKWQTAGVMVTLSIIFSTLGGFLIEKMIK